jgi:uncharacterized coiled-coil DUF342 family protein
MEWFVNMVKTGAYKIPEIQTKYGRLKDEVEMIDHKKIVSKHELEDISNRITCLHIVMSQLSAACDDKRNEFAYLQNEVQQLEGYLAGFRNNVQRKMENENYG